eukprot:TRINITY_DN3318_c1_g1_i3.p1 TRINITY_DN3318_c1_g1~~TRINITY_DN3318_c1_g1_i3.p1  ORF type:complete len:189 (-),score=72.60 TRINITY_DN3318_c1_g1_i3:6-572(-)
MLNTWHLLLSAGSPAALSVNHNYTTTANRNNNIPTTTATSNPATAALVFGDITSRSSKKPKTTTPIPTTAPHAHVIETTLNSVAPIQELRAALDRLLSSPPAVIQDCANEVDQVLRIVSAGVALERQQAHQPSKLPQHQQQQPQLQKQQKQQQPQKPQQPSQQQKKKKTQKRKLVDELVAMELPRFQQ